MAKMKVEIEVSKEGFELSMALLKLVVEIKARLADGLGADDVAPMLATLMSKEVIAGVQGLDQLGAELQEDPEAFINAFAALGGALARELVKK